MKEKAILPVVTSTLDRRYKSKDGLYNACLRVTYKRERRYYPIRDIESGTKIRLSENDFNTLEGSRGGRRKTLERFVGIEAEARKIINSLYSFNFEAFEAQFFSDLNADGDHVVGALRAKAKTLRGLGRLKTAIGYESTANSIEQFVKKERVEFSEITPEWLRKYEKHMLAPYTTKGGKTKTRSQTTIGIYLRNLRHILRQHLPDEAYPFGSKEGKFEIPSGRNIKKALSLEDVGKIYNYKPEDPETQMCRDYWLLSYLCNGANIKDLARLRYKNIKHGESIEFTRSKTVGTKRSNQKKIMVPLTQEIGLLLDRLKVPGAGDEYILPILTPGLNDKQELNRVEGIVKRINKAMRKIASAVGIKMDVTTYASRHSFATIMMQSGASVAMISKALGHSSVNTTESYLGDFDDEIKRTFAAKLTAFKEKP